MPPGSQLLEQVLGFGFQLGLFRRRLSLRHHQNVAGLHALRHAIAIPVLFVRLTHLRIGYDDGLGDLGRIDDHQFHAAFLGNAVSRLVLLVIIFQFVGRGLDFRLEFLRIELDVLDGGLFVLQAEFVLDVGLGNHRAFERDAAKPIEDDLVRHGLLELRNGEIALGEHGGVGFLAHELSVGEQIRHLVANRFGGFGLAHLDAHAAGLVHHCLFGDHLLDHLGDVVRQHFGRHFLGAGNRLNGVLHLAVS